MSEVKLAAETRTEFGKGAARRIRRDSQVPARRLRPRRRPGPRRRCRATSCMLALRTPNVLLALDIEGKTELASRRPCSVTHQGLPRARRPAAVKRGEKVTVEVPSHRGRAGPGRQPAGARAEHAAGRGRGHAHPRVGHRLHRGPGGRCLHPRQGHPAADGHHAGVDEDAVVLQVLAAQAEEPPPRARPRATRGRRGLILPRELCRLARPPSVLRSPGAAAAVPRIKETMDVTTDADAAPG